MRFLDRLERLEIVPDWCIVQVALEWSEWESFVTPAEVQDIAARRLAGEGSTSDELLVELVSFGPEERNETLGLVRQMAERSGCSNSTLVVWSWPWLLLAWWRPGTAASPRRCS